MQSLTATKRLAGIAVFIAVVVMLQVFATFIRPGLIPINLALTAIIIGSAIYGVKAGIALGLSFGTVVLISGISGTAPLSAAMWAFNPVLMLIATFGRGALMGSAAGFAYSLVSKKNRYLGVICAAIAGPVVNTGTFFAVLYFMFRDILNQRAGDTPILYHLFIVMAGGNFLFELIANIALCPTIFRIINIGKKQIA